MAQEPLAQEPSARQLLAREPLPRQPGIRAAPSEVVWQLWPVELAIAAFPRDQGRRVLRAVAACAGAAPLWWGDDGFEVTVVAPREVLERGDLGGIHGSRIEAGWALITCLTPLPWDVVGFLAGVTARLAGEGITCGAFSAYSRDHLLVPWQWRERVMQLLTCRGTRCS